MCQKLHGGAGPHSKAAKKDIVLTKDTGLSWYRSSDIARRGYCRDCGSSLFWDPFDQEATGILAGALDDSSGLKVIGHIFVAEKAPYYEIFDELPRYAESSDGDLPGDSRQGSVTDDSVA